MIALYSLLALWTPTILADVGTAGHYNPPYQPTACWNGDASQFPSSNLFGCANEGIWDNGAACGRQYLVRCISAASSGTCKPGVQIQITILDYCGNDPGKYAPHGRFGNTITLSNIAYDRIADRKKAGQVNVEFMQV